MPTEPTNEDLEKAILESAIAGVESTVVDGFSVREQSLKDRMAVADRKKNQAAAATNSFGMRSVRLISGGGNGQ